MANKQKLAILKQGVEVWNEWREHNPTERIDLSEADLRSENLSFVDLSKANLQRADFGGTYLWSANLKETDLSGAHLAADLTDADLSGAWFYSTDFYASYLKGAHLNGTRLINAIFRKANLEDADLTAAVCGGLIFADTDLTNVKGLETLRHLGPSSIGIDTLLRTKTQLADAFLRGCGVPQNIIGKLPAIFETTAEFYSCFISYSGDDEQFATRLFNALQAEGISCWKASEQILPGNRIAAEIDRGVTGWDKLLLCCSKSSLTQKWWVDFEVEKAFAKERRLERERGQKVDVIIPLDLDGFLLSEDYQDERKSELTARFSPNFLGWEDNSIFEREIECVIKALRTDGGKEPPPKSKL